MGDWRIDWCSVCSDADAAPGRCGEETVERKSEAVDLCPYSHLWS